LRPAAPARLALCRATTAGDVGWPGRAQRHHAGRDEHRRTAGDPLSALGSRSDRDDARQPDALRDGDVADRNRHAGAAGHLRCACRVDVAVARARVLRGTCWRDPAVPALQRSALSALHARAADRHIDRDPVRAVSGADEKPRIPRITIVGGGFSGASAAIQLLGRSAVPLGVTIVEPRANLVYGLAYSSDDPDHRLN